MFDRTAIAVTGVGIALPGASTLAEVPAPRGAEPVDPAERLGKKGLRYKDRATRLGLVAAYDALRHGDLLGEDSRAGVDVDPASVGVIVSSNLGNLDSVCDVVGTIAENRGTRLVSPITTPNLSSNVIASEVAIRYQLRGPNLTVCNGATSGLDAVRWAKTWLRSGRMRFALLVGAEPDTEVARELTGSRRIVDGAVALLLEPLSSAVQRGTRPLALVGDHVRAAEVPQVLSRLGGEPRRWYPPEGGADLAGPDDAVRAVVDEDRGACSGLYGLLQCVLAVADFQSGLDGPVLAVAGGPGDDGCAGLMLTPARMGAR